MRIAVGSDHAGYRLKQLVMPVLREMGHEIVDCGADDEQSTDYPVHAAQAAKLVSEGDADRAVLACGTGAGVSIVANKFEGVRAVNAVDADAAALARKHNDANVLCLGGRRLSSGQALAITEIWMATEFEGGRHARRVQQIAQIERGVVPTAGQAKPASSED